MIRLGALLKREFSFITGNYQVLLVSWMIMDLAMEMPVPYFQYYVTALNGTGLALGLIGLANWVAMAVVAFPGGYLADKYGRRWLITTMTFIMALSNLFFAFAPSWEFILIGSIIHSLCLIYQPALFAMVQDSLPPERRGMGSSLIQLIHGAFNTPGPLIARFSAIYVFGYSLGGHLALCYATEAADPRVRRVGAICPPLDIEPCIIAIDGPELLLYRANILRCLAAQYATVAARRTMPVTGPQARAITSMREWDTRILAPRHGFASAEDYYERASVGPRLQCFPVRALLDMAQSAAGAESHASAAPPVEVSVTHN